MKKRFWATRLTALLICFTLACSPNLRARGEETNFAPETVEDSETWAGGAPEPDLEEGQGPEEEPAPESSGEAGVESPPEEEEDSHDVGDEAAVDDDLQPPAPPDAASGADTAPAQGATGMLASPENEPDPTPEEEEPMALAAASPPEDVGIMPLALNPIDTNTVEVSTYADLAVALSNANNFTEIYLTDDITADTGISIGNNKAAVTIYGHPYGDDSITHTLTQYSNSSAIEYVLLVENNTTKSVTVRDINVVGYNYYGIVGVRDEYAGVTIRYENLTYSGPQPCYNRNGRAEFVDCTITQVAGAGGVRGEVAEAHQVYLAGDVTVTNTDAAFTDAVFWLTNESASLQTLLEVETGANVIINSPSYLLYADQGTNYRASIVFGQGCTFVANTARGVSRHYVNWLMEPDAQVSFIHTSTTNDGGINGLLIRDSFVMQPGSGLRYVNNVSAYALLLVEGGRNASIQFNDPQRVYLFNQNGILFGSPAGSSLHIETDALNMWRTATSSAAQPDNWWNKLGENKLTVDANFALATQVTNLSTNLDPGVDPVDGDITTANFQLRGSRLMVFGRILLRFGLVTDASASVPGSADPGAELEGTYTQTGGSSGTLAGTAAGDGTFDLPLSGGPPQLDSRVNLTTYFNDLRARQYTTVENNANYTLSFVNIPATLPFQTMQISSVATYANRQEAGWTLSVQDNRPSSPGFRVDASITAPLTGIYNGQTVTLPDALVYVNPGGTRIPLSAAPLTVYSNSSGTPDLYPVSWPANQGPLVWVVPDYARATGYATTIQWDLVDAP